MIKNVVYGIILGLASSFLWGKAFSLENSTIVIVGVVGGSILGLLVGLWGKAAKAGGNLVDGEITFVNSSLLMMIGGFLIITGCVALLVSSMFF